MPDKNALVEKTQRKIRAEKIINEISMTQLKTELLGIGMYKDDILEVLKFQENDVDQLLVLLSPEAKKICSNTYGMIKRAVQAATYRAMAEFPSLN